MKVSGGRKNRDKALEIGSTAPLSGGTAGVGKVQRKKDDDITACILSDSLHLKENCRILTGSKHIWITRIREGLSVDLVVSLANKMKVPQKELAGWLHITPRTLQRHIETQSTLSAETSDRLAQIIRVYCRCNEVFKDDQKVSVWLKTPNFALGGVAPFSLLDTMVGIDLVLDEVGRIEHGVFI